MALKVKWMGSEILGFSLLDELGSFFGLVTVEVEWRTLFRYDSSWIVGTDC
jgi:hypothetical protein